MVFAECHDWVSDAALSGKPPFVDLAGGCLGQFGHEYHMLRHHEFLQALVAKLDDIGFGERHVFVQDEKRLEGIAQDLIGHADYGGLFHGFELIEDILDFPWTYPLTSSLDEIVFA